MSFETIHLAQDAPGNPREDTPCHARAFQKARMARFNRENGEPLALSPRFCSVAQCRKARLSTMFEGKMA